jgi:5-methyltetrahydropteroyltriglutamate--homocysteine methyltransferase
MKRSSDRILTTHAGSLPRPPDLREMLSAKQSRQAYERDGFGRRVHDAVGEAVQLQTRAGIDVVNDGELSKFNFLLYARERLGGVEERPVAPGSPQRGGISGRDAREFPEYFAENVGRRQIGADFAAMRAFCTAPLSYVGRDAVQTDIANFKAALQATPVEEAFLPAIAPGTIEHWLGNAYYANEEAYLAGIADALHEEYRAIVDAGFILQIDDPGMADGWQINRDASVAEYRRLAGLHVDALNHALRDLPEDRVRYHICWGSYHGPHKHDIPLQDIVDLVLNVRAQAYSIEASNPCHAHEWQVWENTKLPNGKILIPGVVGHHSDFVEHPELVAERLVRYARIVGRENVIAGTDCGLGGRVGHPSIVRAKFQAMAEGAQLATKRLWE